MKNRPLFSTLGVFGVVVFALGVMVSSYLSSSDEEPELEACGWFGNCGPERRRTEPGKGWTGEIRAKALVETDRALDLGEDTLASIDGASASVKDWNERYASLPNSDAGLAISGDDSLVASFYVAWERTPPPAEKLLERSRRDVENLLAPARAARASEKNRFDGSDTLLADVEAQKRQADSLRGSYEERKRALDAVLARATPATRGTRTLEVARVDLETRRAEDKVERERRDQERKKMLRVYALSPATRDNFRPFLQAGFWQGRGPVRRVPADAVASGLSYGFIKQSGAMGNLERFLDLACDTDNDRAAWARPHSDGEWANAKQRFNEFREYASVWHSEGLLPD